MSIFVQIAFILLVLAATWLFVSRILLNWKRLRSASPFELKTTFWSRVTSVLVNVIAQKKLFKSPMRGIFHAFIFYGFLVYLMHTMSQIAGGVFGSYMFYFPEFVDGFLPGFAHYYDFFLDLFSLLVIAAVIFFGLRRWVHEAPELARPSQQSAIVLSLIFFLMFFSLIGEPARTILSGTEREELLFLRGALVDTLRAAGASDENANFWFLVGWWGHILTIFAFMIYVPRSKHAHLIWAPVNFFFRKETPKGTLAFVDLETAEIYGSNMVQEFTWRDHLGGLSCIECGRCTLECPANQTGKILNPRDIMLGLKHSLEEQMDKVNEARKPGNPPEKVNEVEGAQVIGHYISEEALWACTSCYACVNACPVGNHQVDAIVGMRRSLVLNEGKMPGELQNAMVNMENQSNPWGAGAHKREEWAEGLDIKTMAQWKDSGETPDVLYWVGCAGAFDDRGQKIARSFANVLNEAGIKYGILGTEENCTGDSARRAGNEYLYQMLAQQNIETLNGYGVKKIVATCPHCMNTLSNEYPDMGGNYEVVHHADFLNDLLEKKTIELDSSKSDFGTVTYHDSCYLGRYNEVYDSPRNVIQKAVGEKIVNPLQHGEHAMCCGAGGAQMWKEEEKGSARVNIVRTEQLLATDADTVASACPFCMTMLSDGAKALERAEEVKNLDIAEIVERSMIVKEKG